MVGEKEPTRVLVVDDEPLLRWALAETLCDCGCDVAQAADCSSTMAELLTATGRPFDVVLLDYQLPDSHDLDLLAVVKHASPASGVVLMSAFTTPELRAGALARGADAVIAKPFDLSSVPSLVDTLAPRSRWRR